MLKISQGVSIPEAEIEMTAMRARGAGGQNVNKVSSAIQLRFDIRRSSLPEFYRQRLLSLGDRRISKGGVIIIKAQRFRTQLKNKEDALDRLGRLIRSAAVVQKTRRTTTPSRAAKRRRVDSKTRRGKIKALRGRVPDH